MSSLHDVVSFGLEHVGLAVVTTVIPAAVVARYVKSQGVRRRAANTDRRLRYLGEDFRRWMSDRDRQAQVRMNELRQQANANGVLAGGTLLQGRSKTYRH